MKRHWLHRVALIAPTLMMAVFAVALSGCSWFGNPFSDRDDTAKWDADKLYSEARLELNNGSWKKSRELYQKLESRYPFGRHAQQALMEIAYTYYKEGESAQAIQAADRFIRQYPNHPNVDYMYYLKGLASFNEELGFLGQFLGQDVSERDSKAAREAFDAFKELVTRYPDSKYTPDARARMTFLANSQGQAELNIARYYFTRKAYIAAIQRAQTVVREFQQTPSTEEALSIIARSYAALQMKELQADAERVLAINFPDSKFLSTRK